MTRKQRAAVLKRNRPYNEAWKANRSAKFWARLMKPFGELFARHLVEMADLREKYWGHIEEAYSGYVSASPDAE